MKNTKEYYETMVFEPLFGNQPLGMLKTPKDSSNFIKYAQLLDNEPCEREVTRYMKDGYSREEAEDARLEYLRFISLVNLCWTVPVVPTKKADKFWHIAILFTLDYQEFCERNFGKFIHHRPGNDDEAEKAYEYTKFLMKTLYNVEMVDRGECASCNHRPDPKPSPRP